MQISLGKILYSYSKLSLKFPETLFKDEQVRKFVQDLNTMTDDTLSSIDIWNGVSPEFCTEEGITNEVYSCYYINKINEQHRELLNYKINRNWSSLASHFKDEGIKSGNNKISNAAELEVKPVLFANFFPEWDAVFRGITPEDYIILYALTKHGKSTVASYIAGQAIKAGRKVAFFPTELTTSKAITSIFGLMMEPSPLRPDESSVFFQKYPEKLKEMKEKYGQNLLMPVSNVFDWESYEELYKQKPDLVVLDQMSIAMSNMGLDDTNAQEAGAFSKKLLNTKLKHMIPTLVVMQEGMRPPTKEDRQKYGELADHMDFGTGKPRGTNAPPQDATLALLIYKDKNTQERRIKVKYDRERNLTSGEIGYEILLDNRSRMHAELTRINEYNHNLENIFLSNLQATEEGSTNEHI